MSLAYFLKNTGLEKKILKKLGNFVKIFGNLKHLWSIFAKFFHLNVNIGLTNSANLYIFKLKFSNITQSICILLFLYET